MIKPELYKKTVDILFEAYFNDELVHGNSCACAVGNMVAKNAGYKIEQKSDGRLFWVEVQGYWYYIVSAGYAPYLSFVLEEGKKQITMTGYDVDEIIKIESAFELTGTMEDCTEDKIYNGLVAVLEVLKEIHQVDDNTDQITRFKSHYANLIT